MKRRELYQLIQGMNEEDEILFVSRGRTIWDYYDIEVHNGKTLMYIRPLLPAEIPEPPESLITVDRNANSSPLAAVGINLEHRQDITGIDQSERLSQQNEPAERVERRGKYIREGGYSAKGVKLGRKKKEKGAPKSKMKPKYNPL